MAVLTRAGRRSESMLGHGDRGLGVWSAGIFTVVLIAWEAVTRGGLISPRTLPPPTHIVAAFAELLGESFFYENVLSTLRVIALGVTIALCVGFIAALPLAFSPFLRKALYPLVVGLDVIPKVALIPLFLILLGFGSVSKVVIVSLTTFFPVFLATLSGLSSVDRAGVNLLRSMRASRWQMFRMYELPTAAPTIFAGVKISVTVAFIAAVISEFMIRNDGLGHLITSFRSALEVDKMMAATIAVAAIGAGLFFAIEALERRLVFWADGADRVGTNL